MKLAFLGTGYVGLVSGACMAEIGHSVVCADVNRVKINQLKRGKIPIYEIGLEEVVERNVKEGRLSFTTDIRAAIRGAEVVFMAVGTPEDKRTGQADLRFVYAAAESFGRALNGYRLFVNKSTVPVGTADQVREIIHKTSHGKYPFEVVSNPEFLREGAAVKDFLNPDRIVIGVGSARAKELMEKVYRPIARAGRPLVFTDVRSAEIIKYASNAFLATKISFINEIANFCEVVGGNVKEVARGMGYDSRIGSRFLYAGIGYGGSCFPKDVQALRHSGVEAKTPFHILDAVHAINQRQQMKPFVKLQEYFKHALKGKTIALWGLAFKPRTDDVREAPALRLARALLEEGANVHVFDPIAMANAKRELQGTRLRYATNALRAVTGADALVVCTEWDEFRVMDLGQLKKIMRQPIIFDGRNVFERAEAENAGFTYYGVGT